jgi:hypothetical protein
MLADQHAGISTNNFNNSTVRNFTGQDSDESSAKSEKRIDLQNLKQKKEEKHRGESCCGQRLMLKRAALPSDCGSAAQSTPNTAHQLLYFPKTFLETSQSIVHNLCTV